MKRRDPLRVVIRLRGLKERSARIELGKAVKQREEATETLRRRIEERDNVPAVGGGLTPVELLSLHLRGIKSEELIQEAAAAMRRADDRLTASRSGWQRASAELDAAEELDRRKTERRVNRAERIAEKVMDDLMMLRRGRS